MADIDPDFDDKFQNGIQPHFYAAGPIEPTKHEWGTIEVPGHRALSRGLDYLEQDKQVDASRVAVLGHSRLGKTSLWAGSDERFALVISNNSGCGGAALSRRAIGETVQRINAVFPRTGSASSFTVQPAKNEIPVSQHPVDCLIPHPDRCM
ncbi:MAG: hypothetical protein R3C12_25765 [Planctomycetaceae bacterium]